MKYLNWGFNKTLTFDNSVENRNMNTPKENALSFYCWDLYYKRGTPLDCNTTFT